MTVTVAQIDAAVPVDGEPSRALTNALFKNFLSMVQGEKALSATPDYTVASGAAAGTEIWKATHIPGWGRVWVLRTPATSSVVDTSGALDSADIPGSELTLGDVFFAKVEADAAPPWGAGKTGFFILHNFTDGTPASNIDVKNLQAFGFANTD